MYQNYFSILDLARRVMNKGSKEDLEKFFLIAWGLLYRRNQRIHKERELKPEQVIEHVLSLQKVHNEAQGKPKQLNQLKCFWVQLPPPGAMKLNADGSLFHNQHKSRYMHYSPTC